MKQKKAAPKDCLDNYFRKAVKQSGNSRQFLAYLLDAGQDALLHFWPRMPPPVGVMTELLQVYACLLRQGFTRYEVFRIMELCTCGHVVFYFYMTLKFRRKRFRIRHHPGHMGIKRITHIVTQLRKTLSCCDACYILICRCRSIIASAPIYVNDNLSHIFVF